MRKGQLSGNMDKPCQVFVTYTTAQKVTLAATALNQRIVCSKYPILACPALPRTSARYPVQVTVRTTAKSSSTVAPTNPKFGTGLTPKLVAAPQPVLPPQAADLRPPWRQPQAFAKVPVKVKEEQKEEQREAAPGLAEVLPASVNLLEEDEPSEDTEKCEKAETETGLGKKTEDSEQEEEATSPAATSPAYAPVVVKEEVPKSPARESEPAVPKGKDAKKRRKKKKRKKLRTRDIKSMNEKKDDTAEGGIHPRGRARVALSKNAAAAKSHQRLEKKC